MKHLSFSFFFDSCSSSLNHKGFDSCLCGEIFTEIRVADHTHTCHGQICSDVDVLSVAELLDHLSRQMIFS